MNKELIDMNVNRAIVSINDKFDYQEARRYLDAALNEVGSNKKLAYYDVLKRVINKLQYNVRGFSKKRRVKECFSNLLHFYGNEFPNIAYADVNPDSEIEMDLANSICCEVINAVGSFTKSMRALYIDFGLLTAVANNSKFLNEFMPIILKCERGARDLLGRFNNRTSQINENIRIWDSEINGKYGEKYL